MTERQRDRPEQAVEPPPEHQGQRRLLPGEESRPGGLLRREVDPDRTKQKWGKKNNEGRPNRPSFFINQGETTCRNPIAKALA